jgi:hypothetical protein
MDEANDYCQCQNGKASPKDDLLPCHGRHEPVNCGGRLELGRRHSLKETECCDDAEQRWAKIDIT